MMTLLLKITPSFISKYKAERVVRFDQEETAWGLFVNWLIGAACDGELVMDVYYKAKNWEKELVGWKVISFSSCGWNFGVKNNLKNQRVATSNFSVEDKNALVKLARLTFNPLIVPPLEDMSS